MDEVVYTVTFTKDELMKILACETIEEARRLTFHHVHSKLLYDFYRKLREAEGK